MKKPIPAHIRVNVFHHNGVLRCGVLAVQPMDAFDNFRHVVVDFDFTGALVLDQDTQIQHAGFNIWVVRVNNDFAAGEGFRFQP